MNIIAKNLKGGGKTLSYLLAGVIALAASGAWAETVYWTGDVNNYWDEQGNWRGQGSSRPLPTNDDAYFTNDGKYKNNEALRA